MKAIFTGLLLLSLNYIAITQQQPFKEKYKTVTKDTIHIRGIVYDVFGNVVPDFIIYSSNKEYEMLGYPPGAKTDTTGRFYLKGALFNDTLSTTGILRDDIKVIINGSRYVEIHLPASFNTPLKMSVSDVIARRIKPKPKPATFKVSTNSGVLDYYGIVGYFPPDNLFQSTEKYSAFIHKHLFYPPKAIAANIEGEVEIGFMIERDGRLSSLKVLRGVGYGCEEAVMEALLKAPGWKPATSPGAARKYPASVTINFKLTDL